MALFLAVMVSNAVERHGFFRTAFYFPSVTSSVAITVLWMFLFSTTGVINQIFGWFSATGRTGSTILPVSSTTSSGWFGIERGPALS